MSMSANPNEPSSEAPSNPDRELSGDDSLGSEVDTNSNESSSRELAGFSTQEVEHAADLMFARLTQFSGEEELSSMTAEHISQALKFQDAESKREHEYNMKALENEDKQAERAVNIERLKEWMLPFKFGVAVIGVLAILGVLAYFDKIEYFQQVIALLAVGGGSYYFGAGRSKSQQGHVTPLPEDSPGSE